MTLTKQDLQPLADNLRIGAILMSDINCARSKTHISIPLEVWENTCQLFEQVGKCIEVIGESLA